MRFSSLLSCGHISNIFFHQLVPCSDKQNDIKLSSFKHLPSLIRHQWHSYYHCSRILTAMVVSWTKEAYPVCGAKLVSKDSFKPFAIWSSIVISVPKLLSVVHFSLNVKPAVRNMYFNPLSTHKELTNIKTAPLLVPSQYVLKLEHG